MKKNNKKNDSKETQARREQAGDPNRMPINLALRRTNRALDTESLLTVLRKDAPPFFELAEVVGKWVWIQFPEKQPSAITKALSEFGFHWNNLRQAWQHPCGAIREEREKYDPHKRYGTYFAGDQQAA